MPPSKRHRKYLANYRFLVGRGARELLRVVGLGEPLVISLGASPCLAPSASPIRYAARGLPQFPTRRADVPSRQASFVRSRSTALASMISLRDHPAGSTKAVLGNFRVATLDGLVHGGSLSGHMGQHQHDIDELARMERPCRDWAEESRVPGEAGALLEMAENYGREAAKRTVVGTVDRVRLRRKTPAASRRLTGHPFLRIGALLSRSKIF